jgi:predicted aspartyl protease
MLAVLLSIILGCSSQRNSIISLSPKDFKVQVPLMINARGIIIKTYWGSENKYHVLCLDNFSPSWIKSSVIKYNKSFTQSNLRFKTSTADGTSIKGEVGICDNLAFENITFRKPPFYVMPDDFNDIRNDDGVFGGDLMSTGVWKIDFKNNELTFASNIDSLKELNQTEVFNSTFAPKYINIDVIFGSNIAKTMSIDLGYNGDLLLPLNEFNKISTSNKIFLASSMFKTPASENIVKSLSFIDTVKINHNRFITIISSNEKVKERLIGLQFFKRFDFVIFDFINKKIYLPKKVW